MREQVKQKLFEKKKQAIVDGSSSDKLMDIQAEKLLITTDEYKALKAELREQEDIIRLILEIQKQISQFSYDLNNVKEIIKLEQC